MIGAVSKQAAVQEVGMHGGQVFSLGDRIRDAFADVSVDAQKEYEFLMAAVNDPARVSSPDWLLEIQTRLGDYRNKVETISALTRKGVSAVETLLRS